MIQKVEADAEKTSRPEDVTKEENFPIERARLRTTPIYLAVFVAAIIGYGWCLEKRVNLAGPQILQAISETPCLMSECTVDGFDSSWLSSDLIHERYADAAGRLGPISRVVRRGLCMSLSTSYS